ncbi:SacI homology domain-containing protein [Cladochytrium replicatum]|nr:SacI homology domain-containing protein [Cladochytrium replicatum]
MTASEANAKMQNPPRLLPALFIDQLVLIEISTGLFSGLHMIVIVRRSFVGVIADERVYRIDKVAILPLVADVAFRILQRIGAKAGMESESDSEFPNEEDPILALSEGDGTVTEDLMSLQVSQDDGASSPIQIASPPGSPIVGGHELAASLPTPKHLEVPSSTVATGAPPRQPKRSVSSSFLQAFRVGLQSINNQLPATTESTEEPRGRKAGAENDAQKQQEQKWRPRGFSLSPGPSIRSEEPGVKSPGSTRKTFQQFMPSEEAIIDGKMCKELTLLLSGIFFYCNNVAALDLTKSLQRRRRTFAKDVHPVLQLDRRFFWNESACEMFLEKKLYSWVLPIIQGYVSVTTSQIDDIPFDFILISRRSRERAGLRYQRRGIDDEGAVANFVETEMRVVTKLFGNVHETSFVQIRGSIPLYWSQAASSLKPTPVVERSDEDNFAIVKKHFELLKINYNHTLVVNLVELQGREGIVGGKYREMIAKVYRSTPDRYYAKMSERLSLSSDAGETQWPLPGFEKRGGFTAERELGGQVGDAVSHMSIASIGSVSRPPTASAHTPMPMVAEPESTENPEGKIMFIEFDFHAICKNYDNLELLLQMVEPDFQNLVQYYWISRTENVKGWDTVKGGSKSGGEETLGESSDEGGGDEFVELCEQKGVFRVSCMDCLDRTNVVQSVLARFVINIVFLRLGVQLHPEQGIKYHEMFETTFKHVWANNGDAISRAYTGTIALKGDFTRTGKRNIQGMMNDATNSLSRLYLNNFRDSVKQSAIDFFLGAKNVEQVRVDLKEKNIQGRRRSPSKSREN